MSEGNSDWSQKGATLSDKSARQEFGLTQEEIIEAIRKGKLQFRVSSMYGNPYFRLLRHEVEAHVGAGSGKDYLRKKKLEKELKDINKEIRKLKARLTVLASRQSDLKKEIDG